MGAARHATDNRAGQGMKTKKPTTHISISPRGAEHIASAVITAERLSSTAFGAQHAAHRRAGARWDGGSRSWVLPRVRLPRLLVDLRETGIEVRVSDELVLAPARKAGVDA